VRVSVVISTLDRPAPLARCLDALVEGTRRPDAVVVVDQGTDFDAEHVIAAAIQKGLDVTHLRQARRGLSASQNAGVNATQTDVVAIVDDDCVPDQRWLEVIEDAFVTSSGPLLLTGRVLPLPPHDDRVAAVATRDSVERVEWTHPPLPWHIGTGGNFAVTREAFVTVGGNDERLGTGGPGRGGNDLDLFHRLVASGVTARYEPELLVHHERSTASEYQSRRGTYGFGVGAMIGIWLRRGELNGLVVLVGWVRLRLRTAIRRRADGGARNEARVLAGTAAGLVHGLLLAGGRQRTRNG
jgi:glycosyltransferase involved in cell wall biosynthesis